MTEAGEPVLAALTRAALEATGAGGAWALARDGKALVVVAAAGEQAGGRVGATASNAGSAAYVIESGQPLALAGAGEDGGVTPDVSPELSSSPDSLLSVPCGSDEAVLGVLELVDKRGGEAFSIDDVELVTLLGGIAGAALAGGATTRSTAGPAELARELESLAGSDPDRYAAIAEAVSALLARG